ncbi:MAG: hypothetical protein RJA07_1287 [Bacteroidota bacterium]|jgi:hypothetical protein
MKKIILVLVALSFSFFLKAQSNNGEEWNIPFFNNYINVNNATSTSLYIDKNNYNYVVGGDNQFLIKRKSNGDLVWKIRLDTIFSTTAPNDPQFIGVQHDSIFTFYDYNFAGYKAISSSGKIIKSHLLNISWASYFGSMYFDANMNWYVKYDSASYISSTSSLVHTVSYIDKFNSSGILQWHKRIATSDTVNGLLIDFVTESNNRLLISSSATSSGFYFMNISDGIFSDSIKAQYAGNVFIKNSYVYAVNNNFKICKFTQKGIALDSTVGDWNNLLMKQDGKNIVVIDFCSSNQKSTYISYDTLLNPIRNADTLQLFNCNQIQPHSGSWVINGDYYWVNQSDSSIYPYVKFYLNRYNGITHKDNLIYETEAILTPTLTQILPEISVYDSSNIYLMFNTGYNVGSTIKNTFIVRKIGRGIKPTVFGNVYEDKNVNCKEDSALEYLNHNTLIQVTNNSFATTNNQNSQFYFSLSNGNWNIREILPRYWFHTCNSDSFNITISPSNPTDTIYCASDFTPNIIDDQISYGIDNASKSHNKQHHYISLRNVGTTVSSGVVVLKLDSIFNNVSSLPAPSNVIGNQYFWNYNNINPWENKYIFLTTNFDSTKASIGKYFSNSIDVYPNQPDSFMNDNSDFKWSKVSKSINPNLTSPYLYLLRDSNYQSLYANYYDINDPFNQSLNELAYEIHFQNLTHDSVYSIKIIDSLDQRLDLSTLRIGVVTSAYKYTISGKGVLTFILDSINLPSYLVNDSMSNGIVKFYIRPKTSKYLGNAIYNSAKINFDDNKTIYTNKTKYPWWNINVGNEYITIQNITSSLMLFPNPTTTSLTISLSNSFISQYEVYDVWGRQIEKFYNRAEFIKSNLLNIANFNSGLYYIKVYDNNGSIYINKFVKL